MKVTPPSNRRQVDYNTHLWQSAYRGAWDAIITKTSWSVGIAVNIFTLVLGLGWRIEVGQTASPTTVALLMAVGALVLCYAAVLLAHLLYLTPRKLLYEKQKQLLEERARFGTAIAALENRVASESSDRVTAAVEKLLAILKARHFTHPVAGLYDAGVAELEPPELEELCRQLARRQIAHPFANIPGGAEYWMWLLQSAVERGVHLSTQKDVLDYHKAVELESAQHAAEQREVVPAPKGTVKTVKAGEK